MCLDIDPGSVIHSQLEAKIYNQTRYMGGSLHDNYVISKQVPDRDPHYHSTHNLTMLPSFHISLQTPEDWKLNKTRCQKKEKEINYSLKYHTSDLNIAPIIGDIALAPLCISEQNSKKSAWIPLNLIWISQHVNSYLEDDEYTLLSASLHSGLHLHVSLANLTGNPHDSIARPEDCIIDTITN